MDAVYALAVHTSSSRLASGDHYDCQPARSDYGISVVKILYDAIMLSCAAFHFHKHFYYFGEKFGYSL